MNKHQILNQLNQSHHLVNQPPPPTIAGQAQMVSQMNQPPQILNPILGQTQMAAQPPSLLSQPNMMGPGYADWAQTHSNMPLMNNLSFPNHMYGAAKPRGRGNWKGKKVMDNRKDGRRKDKLVAGGNTNTIGGGNLAPLGGGGGYNPPTLNELEHQNRLRARRFYHKKKVNRMGPYAHAPRNTTSYIIRAKKSGGIASLVSPCPVTPAVLPTPVFSPSREALVDMAKEEWGVDGYGSMKGLIRLRSSPGHEAEVEDYAEEDDGESSESDVEEHLEVEKRLDHVSSRFEMICPSYGSDYHNVLENQVDNQDTHITQLEEENLILKERLYLMERELVEFRRRLVRLERQNQVVEDLNEEVIENISENDSEGTRNVHSFDEKHGEEVDYPPELKETRNGQATAEKLDQELESIQVAFEQEEVRQGQVWENQGSLPSPKERENEWKVTNEAVAPLDVKVVVDDEMHDNKCFDNVCMNDDNENSAIMAIRDNKDLVISVDDGAEFGAQIAEVGKIEQTKAEDVAMDDPAPEKAD